MSLMVREKKFYKTFASMTGVIAMQNLITFAVNLADNVMIGGYSQTALSGVSIVNQIQFLLQMLMLGTGSAIGVLGAQYWGKRELEPIRKATSSGVLLGVILSTGMLLTVFFFPHQVMGLLTNEQAVIEEGSKYLVIVCFSYVLFAISNNLLSALRAVETVKIGFIVNLIALVVNITLNYGLIYGRLGMPELGVEGAAIATLSARVVEFVVVLLYVLLALMVAAKLGIDVSGIIALASVLTLAVSLAVENALANVFGGFTLLYNQPFHSGDFVEIAGQSGTVQEINMSYTTLLTPDNKQNCAYYYGAKMGNGNFLNSTVNIFIEGQPIGLFYGYSTDGIVQEGETGIPITSGGTSSGPGSIKYRDLNGNGYLDDGDKTIIGDPNPDFTYGFSTSFTWKDLTLSASFDGSYGNDITNANLVQETKITTATNSSYSNIRREAYLNAWTPENPSNYWPKLKGMAQEELKFMTD